MSMKFKGFEEFEQALGELARSTAKATLERSLRKAAQPMLQKARDYAPHDDGDLAGSIIIGRNLKAGDPGMAARNAVRAAGGSWRDANLARAAANREAGVSFAQLYLGPALGRSKGSHAHLIEFGTAPRFHKETGKFVGAVAPDPFLRPAFDEEAQPTVNRIRAILAAEIKKTAARVAARAARRAAG